MRRPTRIRAQAMAALSILLALAASCGSPQAVKVHAASEVGTVTQSSLIVGRDGGFSARMWGHQVFIYGDSFVSKADVLGSNFHSNSFSITDDLSASDGISGLTERTDAAGSPILLIPNTPDEAAFIAAHAGDKCMQTPCGARWAMWPAAAAFDEPGGRAIVSYGLVYAEPGAFNFHGVGQSLAIWDHFDQVAARPSPSRCADHPTLMFCEGEPSWGTALVADAGNLYIFGCDKDGLSFGCSLARVSIDSALDREKWQAWNGSDWASLDAAKPVFSASSIIRVYFNQHAGAWMAIYSKVVSNDVVYRTAPNLTGPWSEEALLFTANHKSDDGGWTYDALVQPDYQEEGGRIQYVTYSRPTALFASEFALVRVEFE